MDLEFAIKVHSSISPKRIIALLLKSSKAVAFTLRSPQNAKTLARFKRILSARRETEEGAIGRERHRHKRERELDGDELI